MKASLGLKPLVNLIFVKKTQLKNYIHNSFIFHKDHDIKILNRFIQKAFKVIERNMFKKM